MERCLSILVARAFDWGFDSFTLIVLAFERKAAGDADCFHKTRMEPFGDDDKAGTLGYR